MSSDQVQRTQPLRLALVFDLVGGAILSRLLFSDEVLDDAFVKHLVDMVRSGGRRLRT